MITIDLENKSVTVSNSEANYVMVDGQIFQLTDGNIFLSNLPSMYDVEVFSVLESNHIPRPEPEVIEEIVIPDEEDV